MQIVIGTKSWSTWSLRPWLVLKRSGLAFEETVIRLRQETHEATRAAILPYSPTGLVPVLIDDGLTLWDSLAICEYIAERAPEARLWPMDSKARALGRCAVAEMHSGFQALRQECSMDLRNAHEVELSEAAVGNVERIVSIWMSLMDQFQGPFLLGKWSIADAFYAPVATRFRTYGLELSNFGDDGRCAAYVARLLSTPEFLEWEADASLEILE
jgi:glutathione S-transferase